VRVLTIILKATEYCNANCVYCAVRDKETKKRRMDVDMLRKCVERMGEYLAVDPNRAVNVTWHGGEPLLLGAQFFRTVAAFQRQMLGPLARRVQHTMQSNLTLIDDDLALALKELGLTSIGSSYEYVPGLRRIGAENPSTEEYNRRFFEGLALLRRHDLNTGIIYVVTSQSVDRPVETMIFLQNLLGKRQRGQFRINPMYREGEGAQASNAHLAVTPEQFGHFLGRAYVHWYPRRELLGNIMPLSITYSMVTETGRAHGCEESGVCAETHLSIAPNGDVFQCGRAMDNAVLHYGNVLDRSFDELLAHDLKRELATRPANLRATECADCRFWAFCNGGCPVDAAIYQKDWRQKTYFCATKRIMCDEYVLPLHRSEGNLPTGSSLCNANGA
jgi:uncharacterized protein